MKDCRTAQIPKVNITRRVSGENKRMTDKCQNVIVSLHLVNKSASDKSNASPKSKGSVQRERH